MGGETTAGNGRLTRVLGIDLSPKHGGFTLLVGGELTEVRYVSDKAGSGRRTKAGTYLKELRSKDRQLRFLARLAFWERYLWDLFEELAPDYVGVEDYALDASHGAHYTGEVVGLCKTILLVHRIPFRLHPPSTVKMFTAHDGNASKLKMIREVSDRWSVDFSKYDHIPNDPEAVDTQTSEDLSDALGIAHLVWTELEVRRGRTLLSELHEKEIAVFNRITKGQPLPLLERGWTSAEAIGR